LPPLLTADPPSSAAISAFTPAYEDSRNPGVFHPDGSRRPPPYPPHHVDDNLYADVGEFLTVTVAASVLALYLILGFPGPTNPDPVSWEKFENVFSHGRKSVGWWIDSRRLSVALPEYKRDQLITLLLDSIALPPSFGLLDISELVGHLGTATLVYRWMRLAYALVMAWLWQLLYQRYHAVLHYKSRRHRQDDLARALPRDLHYRLSSLVSRDVAQALWTWRTKHPSTPDIRRELGRLKSSLETERWEIFIPQMIPRDPNYESAGDASLRGGGAYSQGLHYFFVCHWAPRILGSVLLPLAHPDYVHINILEFLVILLQLAAAITRLEACLARSPDFLPLPVVAFAALLVHTDNIVSEHWAEVVATTSWRAQPLLLVYAQLLRRTTLAVHSQWIAGSLNIIPDRLSHPSKSLTPVANFSQILLEHPFLKSLHCFQPSAALLLLLQSFLFSGPKVDPPFSQAAWDNSVSSAPLLSLRVRSEAD
jgi:hypothetical protein